MRLIKALLILIGIAALLIGGYCAFHAATGRMQIAATGEHGTLTSRVLQGTREATVRRGARNVEARMPELTEQGRLFEAVAGFEDMCAACHTPPGGSPTALAQGLNPQATDLAWAGANRSPAELFWVTKHGIRMTAMPAWGPTHSDEELWPMVALITRFPEFTDADYENLLAAAREAGVEHHHHHDDDHDGENQHDHDHGHDHHDNRHEQSHEDHDDHRDDRHDNRHDHHHEHHSDDKEEEQPHDHTHDH